MSPASNAILELVESFNPALNPVALGDIDKFAREAADNGNYFTHYSSSYKNEGRVLAGIEL